MPMSFQQSASCPCSVSSISVKAKPFARFKCHCSICQKLYKQPYADFVVLNAKHLIIEKPETIEFAKYRLPPALNRGLCSHCHSPLVGFLRLAPFLSLAFVPSERFQDANQLPALQGHIFYHRRLSDAEDELPKFEGYWHSELAVTKACLKGLMTS